MVWQGNGQPGPITLRALDSDGAMVKETTAFSGCSTDAGGNVVTAPTGECPKAVAGLTEHKAILAIAVVRGGFVLVGRADGILSYWDPLKLFSRNSKKLPVANSQ